MKEVKLNLKEKVILAVAWRAAKLVSKADLPVFFIAGKDTVDDDMVVSRHYHAGRLQELAIQLAVYLDTCPGMINHFEFVIGAVKNAINERRGESHEE